MNNRFNSDNMDDIFSNGTPDSDSFRTPSSDGKPFRVNLPEDETRIYRSPSSRPVRNSYQNPRTPKGKRVADSRTPVQQPVNRNSGNGNNYRRAPVNNDYRNGGASAPSGNTYNRTAGRGNQSPEVRSSTVPSNNGNKRPPEKKKGGKAKKIFVSILCVLLAIIIGIGAFGYSLVSKIDYDNTDIGENQYISASELKSSKSVKNILIIGSDARGDVSGMRSDTMILASIDTVNKQLKLTSFLRDSLVYIPELQKWNKLNAACSYGGAKMVIDTIEYNFKVKIDDYVLVDFEVFKTFIDALGGVTVSGITESEVKWLKDNVEGIGINVGTSHLTGGAALWYCRVRKIDSDFNRTARQRKVIAAVIDQIKHTNPLTTLKAIEAVMPMISTSVNKNSLVLLGINSILKYVNYDIYQAQVPAEGTWWDARYSVGAVLEMKIDKNAEILQEFIYTKQEKTEETSKK